MARLSIEIANEIDSSLLKTVKDLNKALQDLRNVQGDAAASVNKYSNAINEEKVKQEQAKTATAQLRKEITQLTLEKRKSNKATEAASGSYREAQQRLTALGQSIRNAEGGFASITPEIQAQIKEYNDLNTALKAFDAQMGNHHRHVGNYERGMGAATGVTMEFNRIIQDAPFGMMGIGNNIQQLTANWQVYSQGARAAAAQTGATVTTMGLLKGVMASMLSPANLLTLAIAAITSGIVIYQKWQQRANKEKKEALNSTRDYAEGLNQLQRAQYNSVRSSGEEINKLQTLYTITNDATLSTEKRKQALEELQNLYPSVFKSLNLETIGTKEAAAGYKELTDSILANARAQAARGMIAEKASELLALELQNDAIKENIKNLEEQAKAQSRVTDAVSGGVTGGVSESVASGAARKELQTQAEISKEKKEQAKFAEEINNKQAEILKLNSYVLENEKQINRELLKGDASRAKAKKDTESFAEEMRKAQEALADSFIVDDVAKIEREYEKLAQAALTSYYDRIKKGEDKNELDKILVNTLDFYSRMEAMAIDISTAKALKEDAKEYNKIQEEQKKALDAILNKYATFEQQRAKLTKEANEEIAKLEKEGAKDRADVARNMLQSNILDLFMKQIESSNEFLNLEELIQRAGRKNITKALKMGRDTIMGMIDGMKDATASEKKELEKIFGNFFDDNINKAMEGSVASSTELINEFSSLIQSSRRFGDSLGENLQIIASMVSQVGKLAQSMSDAGSSISKIGGNLGAIGAVIGVWGSLVDIVSSIDNKRVQDEVKYNQQTNDRNVKAIEAVTKSLQRQVDLMDRIYGVERVKNWGNIADESIDNINKGLQDLTNASFISSGTKKGNDAIEVLRSLGMPTKEDLLKEQKELQDYIKKNKWNPFKDTSRQADRLRIVDNALSLIDSGDVQLYEKTWGDIKNITRSEIEELKKDIDSGLLDDVTKATAQSIVDSWEILQNAQRKMMEEFTGTSFESMLSDVEQLFRNAGDDAGEAFSKGFDKIVEDALFKAFSREFLEEQVKVLYDTLGGMAEDGLDQNEIAELRRLWKEIEQGGKERLDGIREILGTDNDPISGGSGIAGQISRAITEDTAVRLEGIWRGMFDQLIIGNRLMQDMLNGLGITTNSFDQQAHRELMTTMGEMLAEIGRVGDNTEKLHNIDNTLVYIESGIATIARNTKPESTIRDNGVQ